MSTPHSLTTGIIDPRPSRTGVRPRPGTTPQAQAWTRAGYDTQWTITVASPRWWPGQLSGDAAAVQSVLWGVVALAEQAPDLSNQLVAVAADRAGQVGAMTVPAQRASKLSAPQAATSPLARRAGADVVRHGLLSRFHTGCRCGWCASRAWEDTCGCGACMACRANTYCR